MADQLSLVKKGKDCLQVASDVLRDIEKGDTKDAKARLDSMKRDAVILANEADQLAKRLEVVDAFYQEKDADLLHQVGALGAEEDKLSSQKRDIALLKMCESNLAGQQNVLRDKESQLSSAESNLQEAERKLKNAIEEERNTQIEWTVGGALFGLLTGGIGLLVGAATGASIGAIVNACREEEKDARSARNQRRDDVESASSAIRQSESQISSLQSQINGLSSEIRSLECQRAELHKLRDEVKASIPTVKTSTEFWQMFKQLTEGGEDRTALLGKVIAKANEKGAYHSLQSRGTQRSASTFFEAWEEIESTAFEGASNHVFSIDYTCVKCSTRCNALPHLSGSAFVCSSCHLALSN